jgi:Secretion system C-terminal sorting domain
MLRKALPLLAALVMTGLTAWAQYPLVTVQQIQNVSGAALSACSDTSSLNGDTVRVHAVVMTAPDSAAFTNATRGQMWVRSGYGPFSGLDVIQFSDPNLNGMSSLVVGDSVELTGYVLEFNGHETELVLLDGVQINILNGGASNNPININVADLNDATQANILPTGEQWEGQYVEIQNVTVVSVDPFSGGTRVSFIIQDGAGNRINISDRFRAQRLPNGTVPGNFVAPNVGDTYNAIRGIVVHSPNGCTGATNGRGYEIHPVRWPLDYDLASAAPSIISVMRSTVTPTSSQAVTVSANILDNSTNVASANLFYAVGVGTTSYTQVAMSLSTGTNQNGTWTANIPAQADGAFVKYYVCASDNNGNQACNRAVPTGSDPFFYTVRDNGTTIVDVQFVPTTFGSANSGYDDMTVTVEGVVTGSAEATNLGFVFIQQENELAWAGIMLTDNPSLATLTVGQKVRVTGTVNESFGFTRLEQVSSIQTIGTGTINPITLSPGIFTTYSHANNEPYEGMLVDLACTGANCLYVVDANADDPGNFAEYRVGCDLFNPVDGCRVIAGRVTNSAFSSLNFSYVNDAQWATVDGIMNVPPIVVADGDDFGKLRGIIAYTFSNMKLLPRNNSDAIFTAGCGLSVEDRLNGSVELYPNPVEASFRVRYNVEGLNTSATATIYDLVGRPIKVVRLNGNNTETSIDATELAAGQYILKVTAENGGIIDMVKFSRMR